MKKLYYPLTIPSITDEATLNFAEEKKHIPFAIKRFYCIYGADDNAVRGLHAHKNLEQVLFCLKGKLKIVVDTGTIRDTVVLDSPKKGLYVGNLVWREMHDFTPDTILFVVASEYYKEKDYIRDYGEFLDCVEKKNASLLQKISLWIQKLFRKETV